MCGLCGLVIGEKATRRQRDIDALADIFIELLLASEHRGPYATGVAWVKTDGTHHVMKEPQPASRFIQRPVFLQWLLGIDREVTYLMGHTRWPSRGSASRAAENHPISAPPILLTHNGTILDHRHHGTRLGLRCTTAVDSELLARIVQRDTGPMGIDIEAFLTALQPLDGSLSLALGATTRPEEILLLKGNMPLDVRMHPRLRVLLYASEAGILDWTLRRQTGWASLPLETGEGMLINTQTWTLQRMPFTFQGIERHAGKAYTGAYRRKHNIQQ